MKTRILKLASLSLAFLLAANISAESKNPEEYPLRIHILNRSETNFYHHRALDESRGEGRANLFANGEVHGVDFNFECSQPLKSSFGYETYPAKWRKPGQDLVVLMPVFGKSGQFWTCDLKTDVKNVAYVSHNGQMSEESPDQFKAWMVKHNYDPEHGKDLPTNLSASQPPPPATGTPLAVPAPKQ